MSRATPMRLVIAAFLAAPLGLAQADARLYHRAWYLEHVSRRPEEALQVYRVLCAEHKDSPLRDHALARQADLLRRLRRPREAAATLEALAGDRPDPVVERDKERLAANAEKIHEREALLQRLLRLRMELAILDDQRIRPSEEFDSPAGRGLLEEAVVRLNEEIQALRPQLLAGSPLPILEVKREAQIQGLQSDEARRLGGEMVRLRDLARALQEAGKLREARQTLQELDRLRGRYRLVLDRFRGRSGPFLPAESRARFLAALEQGDLLGAASEDEPGRFWGRSQLARFLTTPGQALSLDPARFRLLLQVLEKVVATMAMGLEEQGQEPTARKLEAALEQVRQAEESGRTPELEGKLQDLGALLGSLLWRPTGPGVGPGWPVVPGERGGPGR